MTLPDNVHLEAYPCPNRCQSDDKYLFNGSDLINQLPGSFPVVQCRTCSLIRTNPRPTPESIGFYYPDNYGPYLGTQIEPMPAFPSNSFRAKVGRFIQRLTDSKAQKVPHMPAGKMLEIGCASGSFLDKMATKGWKVQGVEFSSAAAAKAVQMGYAVHVGSLESMPHTNEQFDLIVGWMVLEHLHDPIKGLNKLRECAAENAWLVLSVPNCGSIDFKIFKENWYSLHLPNHLYHFTPRTLSEMLSATGWQIEQIHHQVTLIDLITSIGYYLNAKGHQSLGQKFVDFPSKAGRWNYAIFPFAWILSKFGQTGRMTVWARPKKA